MTDFWLSCGHHLMDRDAGGGLVVSDEFLKLYLARPELLPPPVACAAERQLHAALLNDPRRPVGQSEINSIADTDARENWELMVGFRDRLLGQPTLEAVYLDLIRHGVGSTPPLFLNQLVHAIMRNALDGCENPFIVRAAELFFRPQRVMLHEGSLIAADEETISGLGSAPVSPLASMLGLPSGAEIDVLSEDSAEAYWRRSDAFDMALDLTAGRRGLRALAEAMTIWIRHMLGVEVAIDPLMELRNAPFTWYLGLDAEGTRIGNRLWNGDDLDPASEANVVGLYRLDVADPAIILDKVRGEPAYLILAMSDGKLLHMKPQNLLTGLPIRHLEAAS
jgi:hypothetical protein